MAIRKNDIKQAKMMLKITEKYTKRYTRLIKQKRYAVIKKAVSEYKNTGSDSHISKIKEPYLKPLLKQLYSSVIEAIGVIQLATFGTKSDVMKQRWYRQAIDFIEENIGEKVVSISDTFIDDFKGVIKSETIAAQAENVGINVIADRISSKMYGIADWQSLRIAQTEVLTAASVAQNESVKSVGVPYEKTWLAAMINTRHSHKAMHGATAKGDGLFLLPDGSKMEYPRDSRYGASAGEIINCQCFVIYKAKSEFD